MNQFAIFYLLTLAVSFVSLETVDIETEDVCKLKEGKYDHNLEWHSVDTFDSEKTYLYRVKEKEKVHVHMYLIGDESKRSELFPIYISNTIIFENKVEIFWFELGTYRFITIIPNEDTFDFGRRFFPVDNFTDQHKFPVTGILQDGIRLENVTTIKAKKAEGVVPCWAFVALDLDNKPHIFFSTKTFHSPEIKDSKVLINLQTKRETLITVEFEDSARANQFHEFVSQFYVIE